MRQAPFIRTMVVGVVLLTAASMGQGELTIVPSKEQSRHRTPPPPQPYQLGKASWYGEPFHGQLTANGEQYDMFQLTAAHRELPMGTLVRVTTLRSRRSVVVRINDRGPVIDGMIIDLSYAAARELGLLRRGVARVRLDVMGETIPEGSSPVIQEAAIRQEESSAAR